MVDEGTSLPLEDIAFGTRSIRSYERTEQVGEGTYGKVYRAKCRETGRPVAIKKIMVRDERKQEGFPRTALREVAILNNPMLQGQNIVQLIEVVTATDEDEKVDPEDKAGTAFMVFEYCPYDLYGLLHSGARIDVGMVKSYLFQLLRALDVLHANDVVHR